VLLLLRLCMVSVSKRNLVGLPFVAAVIE